MSYWMRNWYEIEGADDIHAVAKRYGVCVQETERINCPETVDFLTATNSDLGLSLGNSYISSRVYEIPRLGMANIHEELLPEVQGGHSVIWAILEGRNQTGFSIHRVDKGIDTGDILIRKESPIEFCPNIADTVRASLNNVRIGIPAAFGELCANPDGYIANAKPQEKGRAYTTPTIWEFLRMRRHNRRMYREAMQNTPTQSSGPNGCAL